MAHLKVRDMPVRLKKNTNKTQQELTGENEFSILSENIFEGWDTEKNLEKNMLK